MDRSAKSVRTVCGLFLLVNLAIFFLPVTQIERQNSAGKSELAYSQIDYITGMADGELPHDEYLAVDAFEGNAYVLVILFMVFPFLVSVVAGIYGIVGNPRQIMTGICSLFVFGCYVAQFFMLKQVWPEVTADLACQRGKGGVLTLVASGVAALSGILSFVFIPKIKKGKGDGMIPRVQEIKAARERAMYHVVDSVSADGEQNVNLSARQEPGAAVQSYAVAGEPRGVLVGMTGMYAGAEILFEDGMTIRLGRLSENDLVFENETHISRRHCELTWNASEKMFHIKDFSSSGSYINGSGQCLPQNIDTPLSPGTILDIGDENNRFRLE